MSNVKGRGQRLIPEELLKYLQNQKDNGMNITQLVDSKGNPRFIEGDGTTGTIEGITITYNKWSLSGTHLMIVLSGNVVNGTEIVLSNIFADYVLPNFIFNKITTVFGNIIELKAIPFYADNYTSQNIAFQIRKESNKVRIQPTGTTTISANRSFRLQVDLLIDSE